MNSSYYDILDVSPTSSAVEIAAAYRKAAKQSHPDRANSQLNDQLKSSTNAHFIAIQQAYETLSDPALRRDYDEKLQELTASSLAATRSIVWQSVSLSDLDYQSEDSEARIYECRCGHKTVIDEDVVDQLKDGPVRIPCLGCSFGLELSGD